MNERQIWDIFQKASLKTPPVRKLTKLLMSVTHKAVRFLLEIPLHWRMLYFYNPWANITSESTGPAHIIFTVIIIHTPLETLISEHLIILIDGQSSPVYLLKIFLFNFDLDSEIAFDLILFHNRFTASLHATFKITSPRGTDVYGKVVCDMILWWYP